MPTPWAQSLELAELIDRLAQGDDLHREAAVALDRLAARVVAAEAELTTTRGFRCGYDSLGKPGSREE